MHYVRIICSALATLAVISASAQRTLQGGGEDQTRVFRAVAKAWSLTSDPVQGAPWPDARPEELAAAALLWKSGGPPPEEGWRLRTSEKSWEGAARKAGVPVDALLNEYRSQVTAEVQNTLSPLGEEWVVLAEIRTLERLTGRGARAIAAELARSDFQALLLEALPEAGATVAPPRSPAAPDQAPPNQWQAADPVAPFPGKGDPKNTGIIGSGILPRSK